MDGKSEYMRVFSGYICGKMAHYNFVVEMQSSVERHCMCLCNNIQIENDFSFCKKIIFALDIRAKKRTTTMCI